MLPVIVAMDDAADIQSHLRPAKWYRLHAADRVIAMDQAPAAWLFVGAESEKGDLETEAHRKDWITQVKVTRGRAMQIK